MKDPYTEQRFDSAVSCVHNRLKEALLRVPNRIKRSAQEIRLRAGRPVTVCGGLQSHFITPEGVPSAWGTPGLLTVTPEDLSETFRIMCDYSVYSYQNDIKNGFVTINGGHRVGLCGTAVFHHGEMTGIRDISSLNIRISRQIYGAADGLLECWNKTGGLLLAGAPCSGKTTILRDLARQLSTGSTGTMRKVVVVDERGELSGTCSGVCHNDLGLSDVLNGYQKGEGILQAVRCLSPDVVVCDEVGNLSDISAIEEGLNAGVEMIASIHAGSLEELFRRKQARRLLETGAFTQVALLKTSRSPGGIQGVYKVGDEDVKAGGMYFDDCGGSRGGVFAVP
ncbi:MAG: stage III sporulation protein AA [Clostridiales bacterium]|jgi:stage III sporulation protein AA|nr:stage III sporulation protein AA [Clostridiales bacterium]